MSSNCNSGTHNWDHRDLICRDCGKIDYVNLLKDIYMLGIQFHVGNRWDRKGAQQNLTMGMLKEEAQKDLQTCNSESSKISKIKSEYNSYDFNKALNSSNLDAFAKRGMGSILEHVNDVFKKII